MNGKILLVFLLILSMILNLGLLMWGFANMQISKDYCMLGADLSELTNDLIDIVNEDYAEPSEITIPYIEWAKEDCK